MDDMYTRTASLLGDSAVEKLKKATVLVVGLGGVGGACAEALARAGVGHLCLIDGDTVAESNLNRQLFALHSTLNRYKAEVAKDRIADINPNCLVEISTDYIKANEPLPFSAFDYGADAIDDIPAKVWFCKTLLEKNIPVLSCMGTGNRLDPTKFVITDLSKTHDDPLAKVMRQKMKGEGIPHLPVCWSAELPQHSGQRTPASVSFVPPVAGYVMAGKIIRDLIKNEQRTDENGTN